MRSDYCQGVEERSAYESKYRPRLSGSKNFAGKTKKFIFNQYIH